MVKLLERITNLTLNPHETLTLTKTLFLRDAPVPYSANAAAVLGLSGDQDQVGVRSTYSSKMLRMFRRRHFKLCM